MAEPGRSEPRRHEGHGGRGPTRLEAAGLWLFQALLRLLPADLRDAAGAEMRATFAARQRDAAARGLAPLAVLWARELVGLLGAALRPRARDVRSSLGEGMG